MVSSTLRWVRLNSVTPSWLFKEALSLVDTMYITEVDTVVEDGDVFFPEFNADEFDITTGESGGDDITFTRTTYTRKKL